MTLTTMTHHGLRRDISLRAILTMTLVMLAIAGALAFAGAAFAKTDAEKRAESEAFHLAGWKQDMAYIERIASDPDPHIQNCVRVARSAMADNKSMLLSGGWHTTVHPLFPLGESIRAWTIMPGFRTCIADALKARSQ